MPAGGSDGHRIRTRVQVVRGTLMKITTLALTQGVVQKSPYDGGSGILGGIWVQAAFMKPNFGQPHTFSNGFSAERFRELW